MRASRNSTLWLFAAMVVLTVSAGLARQAKKIDDNAIKAAGRSGEEWLTYGLNYQETRYSPLKQINATNVGSLSLAWSAEIGNGGGAQEDTPLYSNGVLYAVTNWSIAFAVDARTGKEKWRWDPKVNRTLIQRRICCGIVNRGLGIYNGKIYVPVIDGRLAALDAATGKVLWTVQTTPPEENYTITMAPRILKNKVIIGFSGAEYPTRGFFSAYDTETGKMAWRFYTVPGDPSKPYENPALKAAAATWDGDYWKLGGGGSVWDGMSYDPDLNLLYVGTGNGGPWPEPLRDKNAGKDNLYTASILAVNPDNGQLKWYYQEVPGDSWDFDAVGQLTLADIKINGKDRKVVMQAAKNGFFYVIDRTNGEFISAMPFAQVNWASGYDAKGKPIYNPDVHYGSNSIAVSPGPGGAHNWSPMSFNPNTGLVYIPTTPTSTFTYTIVPNFTPYGPCMNAGVPGFPCPESPTPAATTPRGAPPAGPSIGPNVPAGTRGGFLMAWDPVANKEVWRGAGGAAAGGGTLTTAGNLVFQVIQAGGHLVAYTADKGEQVLDITTGQPNNMSPPITYMLDGKQYITLMGGGGGGGSSPSAAAIPGPLPSPQIPGNVKVNVPVPGGAPGPGGYPAPAAAATAPALPATGAAPRGGGTPPPPPRMYTYVLDAKAK